MVTMCHAAWYPGATVETVHSSLDSDEAAGECSFASLEL